MSLNDVIAASKKFGVLIEQVHEAVEYLKLFGYLAQSFNDIPGAIYKFQELHQLTKDGLLGPQTLKQMRAPRCGCPDFVDETNVKHREYQQLIEFVRTKWNKRQLSFYIVENLPGTTREEQNALTQQAFDAWTNICGLERVQVANSSSAADMLFGVGKGRRFNFDGPGGTLAWAYLPQGDNRQLQCLCDLSEQWAFDSSQRGIQYLIVIMHEIGHLLGLTHSEVMSALMAPTYNARIWQPQANDDVQRIVNLYGPAEIAPVDPVQPDQPTDGVRMFIPGDPSQIKIDGYRLFKDPSLKWN